MLAHMEKAKAELAKAPPTSSIEIQPIPNVAVHVWETSEWEIKFGFNSDREKRRWGLRISEACKRTHVSCLITRITGTVISSDALKAELGLNTKDMGAEEYENHLRKWVIQQVGEYRLSKLPRRYTTDAIVISAIGPRLPTLLLSQPYVWKNAWDFSPLVGQNDITHGQFNVIPKWWN